MQTFIFFFNYTYEASLREQTEAIGMSYTVPTHMHYSIFNSDERTFLKTLHKYQ